MIMEYCGRMNEESMYFFPLIILSKHPIEKRFSEKENILSMHARMSSVFVILKEKFRFLTDKKTIRKIVNKCDMTKLLETKVKHLEVPIFFRPQDPVRL